MMILRLWSPDVVGIVKDYCSVARHHESFLYTYARYHTVLKRTKGIHPDPRIRLPTLRYHDLPTELEDETDGVFILLRILAGNNSCYSLPISDREGHLRHVSCLSKRNGTFGKQRNIAGYG